MAKVVATPASGEVTTGHNETIALDMSEAVTVSGAPVLLLNDGGTAGYDPAHSNATTAVFDYTVASDQATTDLMVSGIALLLPSSITDLAGNAAVLSGAGANFSLRINTAASGPAGPGSGNFTISGNAELELFGASSASVSFAAGAAGTLKLDAASHFAGSVAGFTGPDSIDLSNIGFGEDLSLGYKANSKNSGGTLTVSDGKQTASIALLGQYMASSFAIAGDGHGGTFITDPPANQQQLLTHPRA